MRRNLSYPFWGLVLFLFCWISLPKAFSEKLRSFATAPFRWRVIESQPDEAARLSLENRNLKAQLEHLYNWLSYDQKIHERLDLLKESRFSSEKRAVHLRDLLTAELFSLPAQVTYRDPSSWSSSLWVNVGEENNLQIQKRVVCKNSPVLSDGALVGVVEYVGKRQSRIRLITDSGLSPSVRINRGFLQNRELAHKIEALLKSIGKREDLFAQAADKERLIAQLNQLKSTCGSVWEDGYLAKGELRGSGASFWRSRSPLLRGIGFNYDYPDDEAGAVVGKNGPLALLKEGDLLVTSGLDGVFPPGLVVGSVAQIDPIKEGSYSYEMWVLPAATHLNDLQTLCILPPVTE